MTEDLSTRGKIATRSSVRIRSDRSDSISLTDTDHTSDGTISLVKRKAQNDRDKKRHHCFWPAEEKDMFFDALNEYGKDFDSIQNVFSMRSKRKSDNYLIPKTKDQIRHFYYRTWNKISKYVNEMEGISKDVLEIYGLINYGHLRKKVGSKLDSKIGNKLNALIHYGTILITVKCKNTRIRTPLCRALKKLNNIDVEETHCKINLVPHNHRAWTKVQSLSLNPRLCIKLKTDAMLSDVFAYVNNKWPVHAKEDHMVLKFRLVQKLDTNPLIFKRADVRLMSNYILNNNGQINHKDGRQMDSLFPEDAEDETDQLESQRELEEALRRLRDLQAIIETHGGFTSEHIDNITINRLRAALQNETVLMIHYEWVLKDNKPPLTSNPVAGNSLRRLIHLATSEFIQLGRHNKQVIPEILQQLDEVTSRASSTQKVATATQKGDYIMQCVDFNSQVSVKRTVGPREDYPGTLEDENSKSNESKKHSSNDSPSPPDKSQDQFNEGLNSGGTILASGVVNSKARSNFKDNNRFKVPPPPGTMVVHPRKRMRSIARTVPPKDYSTVPPVESNKSAVKMIASRADPDANSSNHSVDIIDEINKINEDEWSLSSDFSLSSFLYESPVKKKSSCVQNFSSDSQNTVNTGDTSRDSIEKIDIAGALQSLINESSLDYAAKFADLTAQFSHSRQQQQHQQQLLQHQQKQQ